MPNPIELQINRKTFIYLHHISIKVFCRVLILLKEINNSEPLAISDCDRCGWLLIFVYIIIYRGSAHSMSCLCCLHKLKKLLRQIILCVFLKRIFAPETQNNFNKRLSHVCFTCSDCKREMILLYKTMFDDWVEAFTMYCIEEYQPAFVINLCICQY